MGSSSWVESAPVPVGISQPVPLGKGSAKNAVRSGSAIGPASKRTPSSSGSNAIVCSSSSMGSARASAMLLARRRASNIALARALPMDDEEQTIAFEPLDDGVRFAAGTIALPDLTAFFADPLPSGTGCDIPTGTGALSTHEDEPMNELDPRLVDAIDAGSSEVGRQSPQVAYFLRNSRAPSTRRLYRWAWSRVLRSCAAMDRCAMPMSEATAALAIIDGVNDGLTI